MSGSGKTRLLDSIRARAQVNFGNPEVLPHISHKELLRRAKAKPPSNPQPKVSSFADWVFRLYNNGPDFDEIAKLHAVMLERAIKDRLLDELTDSSRSNIGRRARIRRTMARRLGDEYEKAELTNEYDGTAESPTDAKAIPTLTLNGAPLSGRPDLVFRDAQSKDVLVCELKTWFQGLMRPQGKLPPFGWPNVKVQLWCYGMIKWNAPNVILRGYVGAWEGMDGLYDIYRLQPWLATDPRVHAECVQLFEAFGGHCAG